ncbi:glyoxalase [Candidatus Marinamargulisbacteria bacterium SCGC AAA071-K20]|nr:glyoxalase [Candidatus Marinamargulisbacteria bacterium SCGC AAA071-K20]
MSELRPLHLAFPVDDISSIRNFYGDILGCSFGRFTDYWIDINFFGHQLVFHQVPGYNTPREHNPVDSKKVPVPHFGIVMTVDQWKTLEQRLKGFKASFIIEPYCRFKDTDGEQHTMFFEDPNGYCLEFKAFVNDAMLFSQKEEPVNYK